MDSDEEKEAVAAEASPRNSPGTDALSQEPLEAPDVLGARPSSSASAPAEAAAKAPPGYACLSVRSGTFSVDERGNVTDRASARHELPALSAAGPSRPRPRPVLRRSPSPVRDHDSVDELVPPIAHLQESSDRGSDVDELIDDEPDAAGWAEHRSAAFHVTKGQQEKPRRLLSTSGQGLFAVTMRGAVQWMNWNHPR